MQKEPRFTAGFLFFIKPYTTEATVNTENFRRKTI
jgi:hypothetical protein